MKTLKQAILKLPQIDKRWRLVRGLNDSVCYGAKIGLWADGNGNDIEQLHAAAKTFGYGIDYDVWFEGDKQTYYPAVYKYGCLVWGGHHEYPFTDLTKMFRAAFIAVVEHKLGEMK